LIKICQLLAAGACMLQMGAAGAAVQIQSIEMPSKGGRVIMPFAQPSADPVVATINDGMYRALFNVFAPRNAGHKIDPEAIEQISSQEFSVTRNDRILTVQIDAEGCGAYCENYQDIVSFDARTGRRLVYDDLLTPAGQRYALRKLYDQKVAAYTGMARSYRKELQAARHNKAKSEVVEDLEGRIDMNEQCLDDERSRLADKTLSWTRLDWTQSELIVTSGRCSNHAMRALDDVGEVSVKIPYAALRSQMTPYGRAVLMGEGDGRPTVLFGQIMRGTVGRSPITMVLTGEDSEGVHGVYFYDRVHKPLDLRGQRRGNTIELRETPASNEAGKDGDASKAVDASTGLFVLTIEGLAVKGTWRDAKGGRALDVKATAP
jgi:hypothetical protein